MKNDFAKIIFHPQEPSPALPQATRTFFIGGRKFAIFSLLISQKKIVIRYLVVSQVNYDKLAYYLGTRTK